MNAENTTLEIDILQYEGPLDLLSQLVDKNRVSVDRVSIASIADQYLEIIRSSAALDMELGEHIPPDGGDVDSLEIIALASRSTPPRGFR